MLPRTGAARALARAALCLVLAAFGGGSLAPSSALAAGDPQVQASLTFADGAPRLVPADGVAVTTIVAAISDRAGRPVAGRALLLRPLDTTAPVAITQPRQMTAADGTVRYSVSATVPGRVVFLLFDRGRGAILTVALARLAVDFTRKVVLLAPGFGSTLADRFTIFGTPWGCPDTSTPGSLYEALLCLGYAADPALDGAGGGATVVDMSWETTPCRPTDVPEAPDCVATIVRTADGSDVHWRPAPYDLTSLALSMRRQTDIDGWAERLARTIAIYDAELYVTRGIRSSFYLVGHSLGGQVALRTLHVLTEGSRLAGAFGGDQRGLLQAVVSVDGALNWTGGVALIGGAPRCGLPVGTLPDAARLRENVAAVERAYDEFGTRTLAVTSAADPIVGPAVALLTGAVRPQRGYSEAVFHLAGAGTDCSHSTLLWPEPAAETRFPLHDLLLAHIGAASGTGPVAPAALPRPRLLLFALRY